MLQSPFNYQPKEQKRKLPYNSNSNNNDYYSCSTPIRSNNYKYTSLSLLHTPPQSTTHKQTKKKQKTNSQLVMPLSSPTPPPMSRSTYNDNCLEVCSTSTTKSTPSTPPPPPPMQQFQDYRNHTHQVNTPPPTTSSSSKTTSKLDLNSSSIETKLKLIQLKMNDIEESTTKDDINELLQSTIEEFNQDKLKKQRLPRRKFDEFIMIPIDDPPKTPVEQITYKDNNLDFNNPPPLVVQTNDDESTQYLQLEVDDDDRWIPPPFAI